jgi:hypothetical protein
MHLAKTFVRTFPDVTLPVLPPCYPFLKKHNMKIKTFSLTPRLQFAIHIFAFPLCAPPRLSAVKVTSLVTHSNR